MKKSILSFLLALVMVLSFATPTMAATKETKPSSKTIKFNAGTYYYEDLDSVATVKVTNVTSQKTKDFSVDLSAGDQKVTFEGKKAKVIYCKTKTTITLKPNKDSKQANVFGISLFADIKNAKAVTSKIKYYSFDPYTEEVGTVKSNTVPEYDWVIADGSSFTITKPGTYVLYVRPFQFYGAEEEDFKLNPVFIVVKK